MKKLDIEQAEPIRKKFTPDWEIRKGTYLYKKVAFDDYNQVLRFLMAIEKPQIKLDHFADFMNFYNELTIAITTHDVKGLTRLDFELALYIDEALKLMDARQLEENSLINLKEALGEIASSTEIYVDMDGVLADFFGEWARLMDVDHFTQINKVHDIDDALQKIRDTDDFWLRLPMLPEAKNLLNLIKQVKGSYNICSSPLADDPNSEKHKRTWIEQNLSFFPPDNVYITHNKPQYATQEDGTPNILIDDYGVNINAWEAAGGIGFKYKDHKFERTAKAIKQHMQEPVEENFADGKVKGKSRPGRVKKAGASCNGSVTSLRKKAKKYSGERGKMYHWCANMKGGKK